MSQPFDPDSPVPAEPVVWGTAEPVVPPTAPSDQPRRRGSAILAWLVIFLVVSSICLLPMLKRDSPKDHKEVEQIGGILTQFQVRYALGAESLLKAKEIKSSLFEQMNTGAQGTVLQRLRMVIVAGELQGPQFAKELLTALREDIARHKPPLQESENRLLDVVARLYADYEEGRLSAPSVPEEDRALLREHLGWFGQLALTPEGGPDAVQRKKLLQGAQRTFVVVISAVIVAGLAAFMGLVGLLTLLILYAAGWLRGGLRTGSPHHAVYAETFALYLLLFLAFNLAAAWVPVPEESQLLVFGVAVLASLVTLVWPVLRGIPWRVVRQDVGLTWGRKPLWEPLVGIACYVMGLPLLIAGLIVTLVLMALQQGLEQLFFGPKEPDPFAPSLNGPTHPIIQEFAAGTWWAYAQIFLLAAVCAPIVEEIMFRGVLYRHLREATRGLGAVGSFLASGLLSSFVFAIIHPQGWVATPVLMALALGFTIAREWRGSLIPCIVAHAVNNGALMLLVLVMTS
jgi:membrane protease YdiL (CAAX protease family)